MDILIEEYNESLWVAAVKNGRLEGLEIDPVREEVRWGSVYWAKVTSINAGLDAVFLDLDGYNTGILYNKDVRTEGPNGLIQKGGAEPIGKKLSAGDMIAVQAKSAYLPNADHEFTSSEAKTPRMSMDITLPGRYLIFCALMQENQLSVRIRDKNLRIQLQNMIDELDDINGCILRAAAANTQTDVLRREARILQKSWKQIQTYLNGNEPSLIMLGPDAIQRTLSDQAGQAIEHIEVVTMDHFQLAEEWCDIFAPDLVPKIMPLEIPQADQDLALLHYRDLTGQIQELFQNYVFLPNGGNIIIQKTAALTAIDVNKSSDVQSHLALNIEALTEIGRQIRLRNIGGIILIDILRSRKKVDDEVMIKALKKIIQSDPCTVQIHGKTNLGLLEITRNRRTPPLKDRVDSESFLDL